MYGHGMRRVLVILVTCVVLAGCAGEGRPTISAATLSQQQDRVDSVAQRVVAALVTGIGAEPPSPDSRKSVRYRARPSVCSSS